MFEEFVSELLLAFTNPLPGKAAQEPLKPYLKFNKDLDIPSIIKPKTGAVMALIYPKDLIPHILFIERPTYNGVHSGQIAFPGGKIETTDASVLDAALRETFEEIGIKQHYIDVVGPLSEVYVLASNFMVYPYVGLLKNMPTLTLEKREVAGILEIPLYHFFQENIIKEKPIKNALGFTLTAPYYDLYGKTLWGATAMMVSELCAVIKNQKIKLS